MRCHPYTVSLLSSIPKLEDEEKSEKIILQGDIPKPHPPSRGLSIPDPLLPDPEGV